MQWLSLIMQLLGLFSCARFSISDFVWLTAILALLDSSIQFLSFVFVPKTVKNPCSHRYVKEKDVRIPRARLRQAKVGILQPCYSAHYPNKKAQLPKWGNLSPDCEPMALFGYHELHLVVTVSSMSRHHLCLCV